MSHEAELQGRMADYLDDLLDADERAVVEAEIARHPALLAEVARMRAVLYRPYVVAPPEPEQKARILARWHDRPWKRVLRYAAVFAAGAVTTFALRATEPAAPTPQAEIEPASPPAAPHVVRRIR